MAGIDIDRIAEVHRQIDSILLQDWDPIGVKGVPQAKDEYRGYVRGLYDVAIQTRSARAISAHLAKIEQGMGLPGRDLDARFQVAKKILDLVSSIRVEV